MPSPMMTVIILLVLWAIVVVPMVVRRNDEAKRERSIAEFGRGMRALGRRASARDDADVFVPRPSPEPESSGPAPAPAGRRPVPAAQEALMYPPDRAELSEARTAMMARRRRSLAVLAGGSVLFGLLALLMGGAMWLLALPFLLGLGGYVWFLRSQALHDRARRANRQARAAERHHAGYDATEDYDEYAEPLSAGTVVRIDDDDLDLHSMDTIDLTGLYSEESELESMRQRRAS